MNEKLLQYLWNFKIFNSFDFKDIEGNSLEILNFGNWNFNSGADFLEGKIKLNDLILAGNIELHVKSSDWIFHQHSGNQDFDNLILHVVYQHDIEIEEFSIKNIPTLELKNYIDENIIQKYKKLLDKVQFIPCENIFDPKKIPFNFADETLLKKLDEKSEQISVQLKSSQNNYEAVLFQNLAYAFGLKVNAEIFQQFAMEIDFNVINKIRQNEVQLEALFFGIFGWLKNPNDEKMQIWKREFEFLKVKYILKELTFKPKFLRLRPPNFPTIRLSQLANLYFSQPNLFSKIINAKSKADLFLIFKNTKATEYWDDHFNFGKISTVDHEKTITEDFINLIIINAVLPLKYHYHKNTEEEIAEDILKFYSEITTEKNAIISNWKNLKVPLKNAIDSQAFLYHYKNFCVTKKCLNCSIGLQLLKN
ncbi:DUF2851 family protein [Halpernia frigidisoli]|uniref:DUF2851 family protein n=1 Tax=Halpernia frigidisoli TaxID=1125876 RepID=A0A1I3GG05_9FLAO|nr:DUF2851 family protein [Halpernia frigidisoli]SFI22357.1 Protein of unknown function [Halpernia frigidisoli]